jgi:hypothetical protein
MKRWLGVGLLALLVLGAAGLFVIQLDWLGRPEVDGEISDGPRPREVIEAGIASQAATRRSLRADTSKQVLFGDFHVHTTFSFDAFLMNLPMTGGSGTRPPADACDFARYCSALDFWSINDHAENLTADLWQETVDSVRRCNEVAGDPVNPDLVTYLGWEWSHIGSTPESHYGHKNVVLRDTDEGAIPTRPIGSLDPEAGIQFGPSLGMRLGLAALNGRRGLDFVRLLASVSDAPRCPSDVPVRELPPDCLESATTPEALFGKLDDWGFASLVIPHGTAWGLYTPAGSDWRKQLPGHDPKRQTLVEIYSGHGNSEQLPEWRAVEVAADGSLHCPAPSHGYLPSCWRAGELIEARCLEVGESAEVCAARAQTARANYVAAQQAGWKTLPGFEAGDWVNAGQAPDGFQPAFNYRPRGSAQYMLAIRDFSDPAAPERFDFGFLGSSDSHTASAGTGYKEFARGEMTDGRGRRPGQRDTGASGFFGSDSDAAEPVAESVPFRSSGETPLQLFEIERGSAYFVTGGLVAAHARGRNRHSIWEALERKEVYATSGRRTLLWFDLLTPEGPRPSLPMGSTTRRSTLPRFRVRAAGSFEQKPGCPTHAIEGLGPERIEAICRGECHHPGDVRRPISRIEIVRIRPQVREDEPLDGLVEDPWRTFRCPADGAGCVFEFADSEFAGAKRDTVYYARAIEAPAPLIHGNDPLRCRYDESGRCVEIDPCGAGAPIDDDCLSEAEPRAWSSPIYVDYERNDPDAARYSPDEVADRPARGQGERDT